MNELENLRRKPIESLGVLDGLLKGDQAVFRYLPTESVYLASMFKEEFKNEGKLYHTRITLEVI